MRASGFVPGSWSASQTPFSCDSSGPKLALKLLQRPNGVITAIEAAIRVFQSADLRGERVDRRLVDISVVARWVSAWRPG